MQDKFQQLYNLYNGKYVEAEDSSNYAQCMDLVFKWLDILGIPRDTIRHLYAYQVWTLPFDSTKKYFDFIPNGPTNIPEVGDVAVFNQQVGYAGHIAIVAPGSTARDLVTFDQNWGKDKYCHRVVHTNYYATFGWLHPKSVVKPVTLQQIHDIIWSNDTADNKLYKLQQLMPR